MHAIDARPPSSARWIPIVRRTASIVRRPPSASGPTTCVVRPDKPHGACRRRSPSGSTSPALRRTTPSLLPTEPVVESEPAHRLARRRPSSAGRSPPSSRHRSPLARRPPSTTPTTPSVRPTSSPVRPTTHAVRRDDPHRPPDGRPRPARQPPSSAWTMPVVAPPHVFKATKAPRPAQESPRSFEHLTPLLPVAIAFLHSHAYRQGMEEQPPSTANPPAPAPSNRWEQPKSRSS